MTTTHRLKSTKFCTHRRHKETKTERATRNKKQNKIDKPNTNLQNEALYC